MKHRCAVCWEVLQDHDDWFAHATVEHGAVLAEFGLHRCLAQVDMICPGVTHAKQRVGYDVKRRVRPVPSPITMRDGTVYTPIPLPMEQR